MVQNPVNSNLKDGSTQPFLDVWDDHVEEAPWTGYTVFVGLDCDPQTRLDDLEPPHAHEGHVQIGSLQHGRSSKVFEGWSEA